MKKKSTRHRRRARLPAMGSLQLGIETRSPADVELGKRLLELRRKHRDLADYLQSSSQHENDDPQLGHQITQMIAGIRHVRKRAKA